ncbi:hypothetical protein TNIN_173481 [Trichonephila inaurata madagascariensis]|uniref:Uncharacterized protein n=1 Tax=Trichonephila inaurata madagascariensis TaxID=2747483 RepID=A0A8X6YWT9_9ARAC|nr:hypothetical protein TNIN_173481 [Trichonephila inaurata madagascariensis]
MTGIIRQIRSSTADQILTDSYIIREDSILRRKVHNGPHRLDFYDQTAKQTPSSIPKLHRGAGSNEIETLIAEKTLSNLANCFHFVPFTGTVGLWLRLKRKVFHFDSLVTAIKH